ncbi:hypothetical protein P280DRAFT_407351 [Massarina eburnea CBS 473.64]|uniref:N-acetyltransferase domain-containing protein n=1 Tax=Massarina eburnea CBS 473.64 TaxID=1395130 RepID=A0A6A6RQD3_9PLEO|nr:hypothetical protein P280DRAFT_407351 [Massarina eburnea CBS 473.64]
MASKYVLKEAKDEKDMDVIMDVIWAANYTPYDPIAQIIFPVLGYTPEDRAASITEAKQRFWSQHLADPASHWFYVVELESGKAVGCCQWQIFTANPFAKGSGRIEAPWWPEGEYRGFCEDILNQVYLPRKSWMQKPFLALNWMAVLPTHRRRGIGSLLMNAGITRADDLNLECWMESSGMGKPLYEIFGFKPISTIQFDTERTNASDVWRRCEHDLIPPTITTMWRPKGGLWTVNGRTVEGPWEADPEDIKKGGIRI